eukprot:TRINITY_DN9760_c0_g2_i1.p1 TRINITY_DN9760_c0_g2~~TRINITY_DN9760_c0_g2_i1.p1  ORF type:complete len:399 (+),score=86.92 TRINITY_DN9760_c0_g2_i1:61-1197(+)
MCIRDRIKIMEEVYICGRTFFINNYEKLVSMGITHVISTNYTLDPAILDRFDYFIIQYEDSKKQPLNPAIYTPMITDYLKEVFLYRGMALFVEDDNININSRPEKLLIRGALLFTLTCFFKFSVYETWTLINSQILFLQIPFSTLSLLSNCMVQQFKIMQYMTTFPKVQCLCGCSTIVLKRHFNIDKNISVKNCKCTRETRKIDVLDCPSDGCSEYINYIHGRYKIQMDSIRWCYCEPNDFIIGPAGTGQIQDKLYTQLILNSNGVTENCVMYQKLNKKPPNVVTKYMSRSDEWRVYMCKICTFWMYAVNPVDMKIAVVMNNLIRKDKGGIMAAMASQQGGRSRNSVLRNFNLAELKQRDFKHLPVLMPLRQKESIPC